MTILEAIQLVDELKPNVYTQEVKLRWLSKLEGMVHRNVLAAHVGEWEPFAPFTPQTDLGTQLLVQEPYDTIYLRWLEAQIDLAAGELDKYNTSITVFSDEYQAFENDFNRCHMPAQKGKRFRF